MKVNAPSFKSTNLHYGDMKAATVGNSSSLGNNATRRGRLVSKCDMFQASHTEFRQTPATVNSAEGGWKLSRAIQWLATHLPAPNASQCRKTSPHTLMNSKKKSVARDIKCRCKPNCFMQIKNYLKVNYWPKKTKLRMYQTLVRPIVTYACETWVLKENIKSKLRVFERY
jgi:hypothetical protein